MRVHGKILNGMVRESRLRNQMKVAPPRLVLLNPSLLLLLPLRLVFPMERLCLLHEKYTSRFEFVCSSCGEFMEIIV
jgi:hypothetical protein